MLTPADTDSQISSEHVTVSNFQDSANLFICIAIWICPKVGYSQINWFRVCPIFTQTHLHIVPWHVLSPHAGDRPDWADAQVASFAFETGLSRLPLKLCSKCGKLQRRGLCLGPLGPLGPLGSGGAWTKTTKTNMAGKSSNWMIKFRWEHHRTSKKNGGFMFDYQRVQQNMYPRNLSQLTGRHEAIILPVTSAGFCRTLWDQNNSLICLVISTPKKNTSQLGWLFPIYGKIKAMFQTTNQWYIRTLLGP